MTMSAIGPKNPSSKPNTLPNLMALLMILRSTYPLSSFPGTTPSAIKNTELRACSATTRKAISVALSDSYVFPESSDTLANIALKRSVSYISLAFWRITVNLSNPIPVSTLGAGKGSRLPSNLW